jgi:2-oxoisovalerate dehydrogenase E1 component
MPPRCCAPASPAAKVDGSVCVFLEPIALYHTRDLYEEGDGLWLATPSPSHVRSARPAPTATGTT